GCERSKPSRNCAPSSSHSPGAIMKLGSPRGMDTKRPRGSERSKPCHESQLTRRSQPPYPWPHEQAQPGVSKPCRTTVVEADQIEFSAVDAAHLVGHLAISDFRPPVHAISSSSPSSPASRSSNAR